MATAPERSRPLHNFTLPRLKWGNQRFLRCMKVNNAYGDAHRSSASEVDSNVSDRSRPAAELIKRRSSETPFMGSSLSPLKPICGGGGGEDDSGGIEAVRQKLMFDLRVAADRMKVSILEEKVVDESNSSARPWNLRTRRSVCKAPNGSGGGGKGMNLRSEERRHGNNYNSSALRPESPTVTAKSSRLRVAAAADMAMETQQSMKKTEKTPRAKFSISLSREEIERDFLEMAGVRPPRRPKKRPKIVQKQVEAIFPGSWLTEVTPEAYRVPDFPESGKAQR